MPALLYIYVRLFSNSDCTMTHDRIIQFSFITAYADIMPEEKGVV